MAGVAPVTSRAKFFRGSCDLLKTLFAGCSKRSQRRATVLKSLSLNDHRPTSPMFNHRVKNRQQFAHASDQRNFGRFTSSTQSSVKFSDFRIAPTRHQCSHIKRPTHRSPTTPNCATASHHSTIPIQRRHTYQCSDLLSVELSQLRQLSQQCAADDGSDSRHTLEQVFLLPPDRTLVDALIKLAINSIKLRLQPPDMRLNSFAYRFSAMSKPIGFGREHLGNLASPGDLRAELFAGRARQSSQRWPYRLRSDHKRKPTPWPISIAAKRSI